MVRFLVAAKFMVKIAFQWLKKAIFMYFMLRNIKNLLFLKEILYKKNIFTLFIRKMQNIKIQSNKLSPIVKLERDMLYPGTCKIYIRSQIFINLVSLESALSGD